jgi:hypothetical protein
MVTRRTVLAVTATLAALAASGLSLHAGCHGPAAAPLAVAHTGVLPSSEAAKPSGAPPRSTSAAAVAPSGTELLDAVHTVKLFCDLVERGWLWRAGGLCSPPTVWRRHELRALRMFTLLSARIVAAADPRALTIRVRIRVHARRGAASHDKALHEGINTLFFTLGRVGTTTGGWLISAIRTSP